MVYHTNWFPLIDISWSLPHLKKQFMSLIRADFLFFRRKVVVAVKPCCSYIMFFFYFLTCQNRQLICVICSHVIHWWNIISVYFALLSIGLMSEISIAYSFKDVCHILQITKNIIHFYCLFNFRMPRKHQKVKNPNLQIRSWVKFCVST